MLLVSSAAAEENPAPASANADTGRMESIILSASIMLTMRFFMISSPLSVDLSGYTPKWNSRNGQNAKLSIAPKFKEIKRFCGQHLPKNGAKLWAKSRYGGGVCFSPIKKQFRNARRRFGTAIQNILSALYAQSNTAGIQNRFTCPPAAPPARLSGRADGSPLRQRSRPRAARTGRWRSPRPGGRADSAAPARWALRFPADGR